jgi:hypothetical protein
MSIEVKVPIVLFEFINVSSSSDLERIKLMKSLESLALLRASLSSSVRA